MRVSEILVENRKPINETVPLILGGALTYSGIIAAITTAMAGWTLVELVQFISKYNEDPAQITDDQWDNLLFDILLILLPKYSIAVIKRMIPQRVKRRASQWLKNKITERYRELSRQKADRERGQAHGRAGPPRVASPAELRDIRARERLRNIKARKKADDIVAALPEKIVTGLQVGIGLNVAHDYYVKISELDEAWAAYEAGDKTTKFFTDLPRDQAITVYNDYKQQYLAQFMSTAGIALGSLAAAPAAKLVSFIIGKLTKTGWVKGFITIPFAKAGNLLQLISAPAFTWTLFTQTQSGQHLLTNTLAWAMGLIGGTTAYLSDLADKVVKELGEMMGVKVNTQPSLKQNPEDEKQAKLSNKEYMAQLKKEPLALQKGTDPNNPKIIYIGGVQITDKDGFQIASDSMMQNLKDKAAVHKVPDPTAGIQKRPS